MPFQCSICGEESTGICVRCTKDACDNHLCERCRKCSDCCECEVALAPHIPESVRDVLHGEMTAPPPAETAVEPVAQTPMDATAVSEISDSAPPLADPS
jgi:hypothetical protein